MSQLPCLNPSCKSHGRPHPNCHCYNDLAEGGEVSFCSKDQNHNKDCEYFAEGGEANGFWDEDAAKPAESIPTPEQGGFWEQDAKPEEKSNTFWEGDAEPDAEKYGTPGQQALTAIEGAAQGFAGPLATAAELGISKIGQLNPASGIPSISADDIASRQAVNPGIAAASQIAGLGTGILTGTGEARLASKIGLELIPEALGRIGSSMVSNGIANGLIQGGDEISKALLGQGDPEHPFAASLANMGAAGLFGLGGGALSEIASPLVQKALDKVSKPGERVLQFLQGLGAEAQSLPGEGTPSRAFEEGRKAYAKYFVPSATSAIGAYGGYEKGDGFLDSLQKAAWGGAKGYATGAILQRATPMLIRAAENPATTMTAQTVDNILDYAKQIASGSNRMSAGINNLFKAGTAPAIKSIRNLESQYSGPLEKYINNGGYDQNIEQMQQDQQQLIPQFAEGGEVGQHAAPKEIKRHGMGAADAVSLHLPEQAMLLNSAKTRVSNYLSSLRPQEHAPKLIYDDKPDDREQKRTYKKALGIASQPLSILNEIKQGTIEPEHIQHFNNMYPELSNQLKKGITERITKSQLDGEKPSYKIRQGLSLFLGMPLSSEMIPQNIQAAQAVFQAKRSSQGGNEAQPIQTNKKNTSTLTKAPNQYLTADQARQKQQQKI